MSIEDAATAVVCRMQRCRIADSKAAFSLDGGLERQKRKSKLGCYCTVRKFTEGDENLGSNNLNERLQKSLPAI